MIISRTFAYVIFAVAVFPPLAYLNFKLFKISTEVRRKKATLPEKRTRIDIKSISACLLVVTCLIVLSIPSCVRIVFTVSNKNKQASNVRLSFIWTITFYIMNGTFNSLIFFWKNKVLRTDGMKMLNTLKDRLVGSLPKTCLIYNISH